MPEQVARALQINSAIFLDAAFARRCGVNHDVKITRQLLDALGLGNVTRDGRDIGMQLWWVSADGADLVSGRSQLLRQRLANVATSHNEHSHALMLNDAA